MGRKIVLGAAATLISMGACSVETYHWHEWDRDVTKHIEVANGAMAAGAQEGITSMESALIGAREGASVYTGENTAIIWDTPYSSVDHFITAVDRAIERSRSIGQLQKSLQEKRVPEDAPAWVHGSYEVLTPQDMTPLEARLAFSEQQQTIASMYEALNDVIAGKGTSQRGNVNQRSLIGTLDQAGGIRSIARGQANDYKQAGAYVRAALIDANMGDLDSAVENLQRAYDQIEHFPDSKNLSFVRNTEVLSQKILEEDILGAIEIYSSIDNVTGAERFSTGWWDQIARMGESIGGDDVASLTDWSRNIGGGHSGRAWLWGSLAAVILSGAGIQALRDP